MNSLNSTLEQLDALIKCHEGMRDLNYSQERHFRGLAKNLKRPATERRASQTRADQHMQETFVHAGYIAALRDAKVALTPKE